MGDPPAMYINGSNEPFYGIHKTQECSPKCNPVQVVTPSSDVKTAGVLLVGAIALEVKETNLEEYFE